MLPPIQGGYKSETVIGSPRKQGVRLYTQRMSLRGFIALGSAVGLGWAWVSGSTLVVVGIVAGYVLWMWACIPIERGQRRANLPSFTEVKPWRDR